MSAEGGWADLELAQRIARAGTLSGRRPRSASIRRRPRAVKRAAQLDRLVSSARHGIGRK